MPEKLEKFWSSPYGIWNANKQFFDTDKNLFWSSPYGIWNSFFPIRELMKYYFEAVPMGFETHLQYLYTLVCSILKQSLWDLKRKHFFAVFTKTVILKQSLWDLKRNWIFSFSMFSSFILKQSLWDLKQIFDKLLLDFKPIFWSSPYGIWNDFS